MNFLETSLRGAFILELDRHEDERGFFARAWCRHEFEEHGLNPNLSQCNISYNQRRGTLRGMHYQADPYAEAKVVRCIRGEIFDVIIDLREGLETYLQWEAFDLSSENRKAIYIPEGFAHGFQSLEDGAEIFYQMSENFHPESSRGIRWNDPAFGISWPIERPLMSAKDAAIADWNP